MIRSSIIFILLIVATASDSYALTTYGRTLAVERCRGEYASEGCVQKEERRLKQMCSRNLAKIRKASKASIQKLKSSCRKYQEIMKICVNDGGRLDIPPQDVISGNVNEPYWDHPQEPLIPDLQNLFPDQPDISPTDFKNKLIDNALGTSEPVPNMPPDRSEEFRKRAQAEYARTTYEQSKYYEEEAQKSTLLGKVKWGVENWFGMHNEPLFTPYEREMDIQARMRNATTTNMDNVQLRLHRNDMSNANKYSHEQQQLLNEQGTYAKSFKSNGEMAMDMGKMSGMDKINKMNPIRKAHIKGYKSHTNKATRDKIRAANKHSGKLVKAESYYNNLKDTARGVGTALDRLVLHTQSSE